MSDFSNYLESGLLHHVFLGSSFPKPSFMALALTSGEPYDYHTGATIPEVPSGVDSSDTGYSRIPIGDPAESGNAYWTFSEEDFNAGSGVISNSNVVNFGTALVDWGWVSGICIVDDSTYAQGNLLMQSTLDNPRIVYQGDSLRFDAGTLKVNFK